MKTKRQPGVAGRRPARHPLSCICVECMLVAPAKPAQTTGKRYTPTGERRRREFVTEVMKRGTRINLADPGDRVIAYMRDKMAMPHAFDGIDTDQQQNWIAGHMHAFAAAEVARVRTAQAGPLLRAKEAAAAFCGHITTVRDPIGLALEAIDKATKPTAGRAKR